jgi:hypothetical protein
MSVAEQPAGLGIVDKPDEGAEQIDDSLQRTLVNVALTLTEREPPSERKDCKGGDLLEIEN